MHSRPDALREMSTTARERQLNALDAAVQGWRKGLTIVEKEEARRLRPRLKDLVSRLRVGFVGVRSGSCIARS